jgi:hypothetical protein
LGVKGTASLVFFIESEFLASYYQFTGVTHIVTYADTVMQYISPYQIMKLLYEVTNTDLTSSLE